MKKPPLIIVTPALADANNGNWQTAHRWARMLSADYEVRMTSRWETGDQALMIALHARRSADSIQDWRARHPLRPLIVVLTGTDLYRDIDHDPQARRSLELADRLVVLNERGVDRLPQALRRRSVVVLQSCSPRQPGLKTSRHLRALAVGHLREEKDPCTYLRAAARLQHRSDLRFDHIGRALDPGLARAARQLESVHPHYRWLGELPHDQVRRRIQSAHVLVHPSRMEGGAHAIIEALRSGTPVLASRIDGNLGLLGSDYEGVFDVGDDEALASLIARARDDIDMLQRLKRQCAAREALFTPEAETRALRTLVQATLKRPGDPV